MDKPMLLVLCTGNSCRSQMAEAFLRHYKGDEYDVQSAGTDPAARIHPLAIRVMSEVGFDLSAQYPKHTRDYLGHKPVRHLLIVCSNADGSCPRIWPGAFTRSYMPFDDPAAFVGSEDETLDEFRRVRDKIREAMKTFSLSPSSFSPSLERNHA